MLTSRIFALKVNTLGFRMSTFLYLYLYTTEGVDGSVMPVMNSLPKP